MPSAEDAGSLASQLPLYHPGSRVRDLGCVFGFATGRGSSPADSVCTEPEALDPDDERLSAARTKPAAPGEPVEWWTCCGQPGPDLGCCVTPSARGDSLSPPPDVSGRWAALGEDGTLGRLRVSVTQRGAAIEALSPACDWSPAAGTITGNQVSLFSITAVFLPDGGERGELAFSNGARWVRLSCLNPDVERLRSRLARFYLVHCRPRLRVVDELVERYEGRDDEVFRFLCDLHWRSPEATAHAAELFGEAPKWWRCTSCPGQVNAAVAAHCLVCGAARPSPGEASPLRRPCQGTAQAPQPPDEEEQRPSAVAELIAAARREAPHRRPSCADEVRRQLRPFLVHLGLSGADAASLCARPWGSGVRPVPRLCLAALGNEGARCVHTAEVVEPRTPLDIRSVIISKGDLCLWRHTAARGAGHGGEALQCRVVDVIRPPANVHGAEEQYIVRFADGSERVAPASRLRRVWDAGPHPDQRAPQPSRQVRMPPWHPAAARGLTRTFSDADVDPEADEAAAQIDASVILQREYAPGAPLSRTPAPPLTGAPGDLSFEKTHNASAGPIAPGDQWGEEDDASEGDEEVQVHVKGWYRGAGSGESGDREGTGSETDAEMPRPGVAYCPPAEEADAFQGEVLAAQNAVRREHLAKALQYCPRLAASAQRHAEHCAELGAAESQKLDAEGQTIWVGSGEVVQRRPADIIAAAVCSWRDERDCFRAVPGTTGFESSAQFIQLVWRTTTHAGTGIQWGAGKVFVVAHYRPPSTISSDAEVRRNVWMAGCTKRQGGRA
eukprot:TRINITY_DN28554_c0_g1_i1.p1 TRINITY_DN28554_c0_g1~~TRINITY_DN28554_c0_g1_i1.p1  ORF type:complete len:810 (+),score=171.57 TRINITY_DN28554_c0_g1_i1:79-2430(+)